MKRREIKKVKVGESVKFTAKAKKFYKECAYEFNNIGGEKSDRMPKEHAEGSFFSYMLIGRGYPYKAKIIEFLANVGDRIPGFRIMIKFPCGQEYRTIAGYNEIVRIKK